MRILFYAPMKPLSDPRPSGDREIGRGLKEHFEKRGHSVEILSEFRARWFFQSPGRWLEWLRARRQARRRARQFQPDIIFTYHSYYKAPDALGPGIARWLGKPYFLFEAMYSDGPRGSWKTWIGWWLSRKALWQTQHVFTDKALDMPGLQQVLPPERLSLIPPSIDLQKFRRLETARRRLREQWQVGSRPLLIGTAMLRDDRKSEGVAFALRCLGQLRREGFDFQYVHIGGGDRLAELKTVGETECGPSTIFLGSIPSEQVVEALSAADLFVFPGLDEGFGLAYIEAQACGLPVVAFNNGGIPEAVQNGVTGYLTPVLEAEAYQAAIRDFLQQPERRQEMGRNARAWAEKHFDRDRNYDLMLKRMFP